MRKTQHDANTSKLKPFKYFNVHCSTVCKDHNHLAVVNIGVLDIPLHPIHRIGSGLDNEISHTEGKWGEGVNLN